MNSVQQQRLDRFVNREAEMRSFCQMLDDPNCGRPIMVVWGDGGMGKSSLMLKMIHECSVRSLTRAEVVWTDTRSYYDYLGVMRKVRDDIGAHGFSAFTKLVNFFTNPETPQKIEIEVKATGGPMIVGEGLTVESGGSVGKITGIEIRDLMLVTQRTDLAIPEGERMARLTDQFLLELKSVASDKVVVVFLDALEKAAETTQQWVWSELLEAVRDGRLENVRFVIGGRNQPTVKDEWKALVEERQLKPLEESHVKELLVKREVPAEQAEYMAKFLLVASGGVPLKLASIVEAALRSRQDS